jgi:hypothetical protein
VIELFFKGKISVRVGLALVVVLMACAAAVAQTDSDLFFVPAAPQKGFNFPYIVRLPDRSKPVAPYLLVEPNNTGAVSDDLAVHERAAKDLSVKAIGSYVRKRLNVALLIPVFPRPESQPTLYAHLLNRQTMLIGNGDMRRHDLQLIRMIDDARARLAGMGIAVDEKVLMTGFSASGSFTNRFTVIHPEKVQAVATGGLNGLLMLPMDKLEGKRLDYPLGTADLKKVSGAAFQREAWLRVPQMIYMGALDDNDAVAFDDGYTVDERTLVYSVIGKKMQPDRWEHCQKIYRNAGANVTFSTYENVGHWTDGKINGEIAVFFADQMNATNKYPKVVPAK